MAGMRWLALATLGLVLAASGCGGGDAAGDLSAEDEAQADPGLVHIHRLAVEPASGVLYAATHTGLFRVADGKAQRVGDRYQDTMGFTIDQRGRFLGSGHPDLRDLRSGKFAPNLGLIESPDRGRTWNAISLMGKADFHALEAAHNRIYGYNATGGTFMVSTDGKDWETRSTVQMYDFAVDPGMPDRILATTPQGLVLSTDGGRTWGGVAAPSMVYIAWSAQIGSWGVGPTGEIYRAAGSAWEKQHSLGSKPEALLLDGMRVFVATESRGIQLSSDLGRTWTTVHDPSH